MSSTTRPTETDLVDHPRGDLLEQVVGQPSPVGGHRVVAGHGADRDHVAVGALVALHADRADVGQHAEATATARGTGRPCGSRPGGSRRPRAATSSRSRVASPPTIRIASPGPGNGWRQTSRSGRPSSAPTAADLVLEQRPQRLDELELEVVGQAADVVVGLDRRRAGAAAGLDHVGVQRALDEEARRRRACRLLLEHADELGADHLALALGVGDARPARQEPVLGVDGDQRHLELVAEGGDRPARPRSCASGRGRRTRTSAGRRSRGARAARPRSSRRRRTARRSPGRRRPGRGSARSAPRSPSSRLQVPLAAADVDQEVGAAPAGRRACGRPRGGTGCRRSRARATRRRRPATRSRRPAR